MAIAPRQRAWKRYLAAVLALADDFSGGWRRWRVSLCNGQTDGIACNTSSLLLPKDNFEVGWLRDVQEVLWVAAPELVLAAIVESTLATSCHLCVPFGCE